MLSPEYPTAEEWYADKAHAEKRERMHGPWAPDLPPCVRLAGRNVRVQFVKPPIAIRWCDWVAYFEDPAIGDPQGYGATLQEALQDLAEKCEIEYP